MMIERLKPYDDYKQSGSKWLDIVPVHWEVSTIGRLLAQRKEANRPIKTKNILSLSLHTGVIPYSEKKSGGNKAKGDLSAYVLAYPGDIVINSMNVVVGSVGLSKYFGAVSPVYYILYNRNDENKIEFFNAVFQDSTFQQSLWGLGNGILFIESKSTGKLNTIRMRIPMSALKRVQFPYPPPDEQTAIVRYLDYANRKIDSFIRAKRNLIGLLNEQKQAIIQKAVTCGLSSDTPLKPSGISWLGDIPAHWDLPLLGRFLKRIEQGWSPVAAEGELSDNQWCVLTLSSVRKGFFNPEAIKPVSLSANIPRNFEIASGDLLLTRSNTRDRVGDVCLVRDVRPRTLLCDLIYRLSLKESAVVPQFLVYQLLCPLGRSLIEKDARGSSGTMPKISQSHIKSWRILLPSINEQQLIVKFIKSEIGPIEKAILSTEREITLMQEYRTRLTSDIVTGKLDVRDAVAKLPELPQEESTETNEDEIIENLETEVPHE